MTTFLYIVVAIILLIVLLAIIAPKNYDVNRTIDIQKPLPELFNYLKYIENMDNWSPWAEKDPNMTKTSVGTDGEPGYISAWVGNKDVGEGEQEIISITENELIETQLRFLKPFKSTSDAYIKISESDNGTNIVWGFSGRNKFPISIMFLFMNIDKQVGKDFEYGLAKLKRIMES